MPKFKLGDTVYFALDGDGELSINQMVVKTIVQTDYDYYYLEEPIQFSSEEGPTITDGFAWTLWCCEAIARATREEAEADLVKMEASNDATI